jgi:CheY-like chemotaxis protein
MRGPEGQARPGVEGRRMTPRRRERPLVSMPAVRTWATGFGIEVGDGEIADGILAAYLACAAPPKACGRRPGRPRILLVEDEPDMRMWLRIQLEMTGWDVTEAPDGPAALARYGDDVPDVVILDEHMPVMRGIEVARAIRSLDGGVRLLMFSASVSGDVIAAAEQLGVHFVSKVNHAGLLRHLELLQADVNARG